MYKEMSYYLEIANNKKYKSLLHNSELNFHELIAFLIYRFAYDFVYIEVGDDKTYALIRRVPYSVIWIRNIPAQISMLFRCLGFIFFRI